MTNSSQIKRWSGSDPRVTTIQVSGMFSHALPLFIIQIFSQLLWLDACERISDLAQISKLTLQLTDIL